MNVNNRTGKSDGQCSMRSVRQPIGRPCQRRQKSVSLQRLSTSAVKFGLLNAQSVGNSSTAIATTIIEGQYDVFLITETWYTTHNDVALRHCVPAGYACMDVPRPSTEIKRTDHGGVAAIISDALDFRRLRSPFSPTTFESAACTIGSHDATVGVLLLYRPGSSAVMKTFYSELTEYLEVFALYKCQIVIAGDFNIHVEKDRDSDATRLQDILDSFDCTQHVLLTPTHCGGGTLDLVITKSEQTLTEMKVDPPDVISDHSLISWCCPLDLQPSTVLSREVRGWAKLDCDGFRAVLLDSELCSAAHGVSMAEDYFELYHNILTQLADWFAPIKRLVCVVSGWQRGWMTNVDN